MLGPEAATTLFKHVPPLGWADVAIKHDLAALDQRIELRFNGVDHRVTAVTADLRATFEREVRAQAATFEDGPRSQPSP